MSACQIFVVGISSLSFITHNLSVSDVIEDGLQGLGLQHHVLDEVHVEVVEVHLADGVSELVLELVHLVLKGPHLPAAVR